MGSHSVTCHPAEVTFPPLPQPKLVLDLATAEECKAELTLLAGYIPGRYARPKTVTHPGTNRARRGLTSFMRRTPLTTAPRRQLYVATQLSSVFTGIGALGTPSRTGPLARKYLPGFPYS